MYERKKVDKASNIRDQLRVSAVCVGAGNSDMDTVYLMTS